MSNGFTKIENNELINFVGKVKETPEFKLIVFELIKNKKIAEDNFEVMEASRLENSEFKISILTLVQENIKVVFIDSGEEYKVTLRMIEKTDGIEMDYLYEIFDRDLILIKKVRYDYVLEQLKELEDKPIVENFNKEEVKANLPCIHGNWCGAGCSGPKDPIDVVDRCCQTHDNCYGEKGYSTCSCDRALRQCLKPYVAEGNKWAIAVSTFFKYWPCIER